MNTLNTSTWKSYPLDELFDITGTKTTPIRKLEEFGKGEYPYVTTQATSNGVKGFYNYYTEDGGVLTVDSAVLGYCSYQGQHFSASDHVEKMVPKFDMTPAVGIFIATVMNMEQYRYNYGRKASQTRLRQSRIKLPQANTGEPDWAFMDRYIHTHTHTITEELVRRLNLTVH